MKIKKAFVIIIVMISSYEMFSQGFNQKTIVANANMGVPHLYRGIVKVAANSNAFKNQFSGKLEVSDIKGMFPVLYNAEFGLTKYIGLGICGGIWNIQFQVKDYYNILHVGQITGTDEIDTYKFKVTSSSIGLRPNIHIPIKNPDYDFYLGLGIGLTSNKLNIDFSSTDVNKVFPNLNYDLSLPGGVYFAPTLGLRKYFGKNFGLNFELGYNKGAILQGGFALRFNHKINKEKEETKN